jgi:hypothetical protein
LPVVERCERDVAPQPAERRPATHAAVVLDDRLFGTLLPASLQDGCRRLARLLGVPLLQVLFHRSSEDGWQFVAASGTVDFRLGGAPLAAALARACAAGAAS